MLGYKVESVAYELKGERKAIGGDTESPESGLTTHVCENYYRETTGNCETLVRAVDGHAVHGDKRTVGNRSNQKQTLQSVAESPITAAVRERGKCH